MSIFFLGAGFSRPAGLPLGNELFSEIIEYAKNNGLYERGLKSEIKAFINYYHAVNGVTLQEEDINIEEFMSYIDIGDFLWLRGGG
jgi:hypothetical protein